MALALTVLPLLQVMVWKTNFDRFLENYVAPVVRASTATTQPLQHYPVAEPLQPPSSLEPQQQQQLPSTSAQRAAHTSGRSPRSPTSVTRVPQQQQHRQQQQQQQQQQTSAHSRATAVEITSVRPQ